MSLTKSVWREGSKPAQMFTPVAGPTHLYWHKLQIQSASWFFWIFFSISTSTTTTTLNQWYLGSFRRFHWNSCSTFRIAASSLRAMAPAALQQLVWVRLLFKKPKRHWSPYCSLFSCLCCQDGGWQGRARHARQAVRAPRLPCRRSSLDEATGFLSEAQAHKQPLGPVRTCECRRGARMKQCFIIITDWF